MRIQWEVTFVNKASGEKRKIEIWLPPTSISNPLQIEYRAFLELEIEVGVLTDWESTETKQIAS